MLEHFIYNFQTSFERLQILKFTNEVNLGILNILEYLDKFRRRIAQVGRQEVV